MKMHNKILLLLGVCTVLSLPAFATVTGVSLSPSVPSPQKIGTSVTWTATASDTDTGPVAFQFTVVNPNSQSAMVKDFLPGTLNGGVWTSPPFVWVPTGIEGAYRIQVVAKDFGSTLSGSKTVGFHVSPLISGSPTAVATANPLVALFSAPSCPAKSAMRVAYQQQAGGAVSATNWVGCHPPATMTFEVAGMYPSTTYNMFSEVNTNGTITKGTPVQFTTGALPKTIAFPKFSVAKNTASASYPVVLHNPIVFASQSAVYPDMATDLNGRIIWYYQAHDTTKSDILTRPLPGGGNLTIQDDLAWAPGVTQEQYLRQIDLAGNVVRETNMGAIQQGLLAKGAVDGGPCSAVHNPPQVGDGCVGGLHHDAIETLPNGYTAALLDIEKIFPPGTQGDASTLPVDIIGDMIVVLDQNWQVVWYWDSFDPAHGGNGYAKLPVSSTAILGGTCGTNSNGCPPMFLLSPNNIAPLAHDWLHANTLYYWPHDGGPSTQKGDILWSARHQDAVYKIDYQDGAGSGDIIWAMGKGSTDFTFVNTYNDPWPWYSGQHDIGIENGGTGNMTLFDNGNTRIQMSGSACKPYDCHSRGQANGFSESSMTVWPVVNFDLGSYSAAMGSAQLLGNGDYFFENPIVYVPLKNTSVGYSMEIGPTPAAPQMGAADLMLDLVGPQHYRGWQLQNLYSPPTT